MSGIQSALLPTRSGIGVYAISRSRSHNTNSFTSGLRHERSRWNIPGFAVSAAINQGPDSYLGRGALLVP